MIKLQFKLPQTLISQGFTRRTVLHAPAFLTSTLTPKHFGRKKLAGNLQKKIIRIILLQEKTDHPELPALWTRQLISTVSPRL